MEDLTKIRVDLSDLTKKQCNFLSTEFDVSDKEISNMTADRWAVIREKAFDIEAELLPEDPHETICERCQLATSIIDHDW